jgi:peptidoglycan/LPS O-acetylase OafA/YrhL
MTIFAPRPKDSSRCIFVALEGLRGVAAIAVAVGHAAQVLGTNHYFSSTELAVDFFFMLSGFVLAHAYEARLRTSKWFLTYLVARIIRLYPLIVFGVLLAAVAHLVRGGDILYVVRLALQGAVLVPELNISALDPSIFPLNPPAWSLLFEMIASICFGLGLWFGRKTAPMLIFSVAALLFFAIGAGTFDLGWSPYALMGGLARVMFGMGAGVFLYRIHSGGLNRLPTIHISISTVALLLIVSGLGRSLILHILFVFVVFPILILSSVRANNSFVGVCRLSGNLSYPLYILHWPIYLWIDILVAGARMNLKSSVLTGLSILVAVILSLAVLRFYDQPARRWLTGKVRRLRPVPIETSGAP